MSRDEQRLASAGTIPLLMNSHQNSWEIHVSDAHLASDRNGLQGRRPAPLAGLFRKPLLLLLHVADPVSDLSRQPVGVHTHTGIVRLHSWWSFPYVPGRFDGDDPQSAGRLGKHQQ